MRDVWLVGCREIVVEIMASINVSTLVNSPHSSPRLSWISQLLRVLLCRPKRKSSFRCIFALYERQQIAKGCTQGRFPQLLIELTPCRNVSCSSHAGVGGLLLAVCRWTTATRTATLPRRARRSPSRPRNASTGCAVSRSRPAKKTR